MSRSVFVPKGADVVYHYIHDDGAFDVDWLYWDLQARMPSLERADRWIGREGYVFAENGLAQFGMSQYGNVLAIWVLPQDDAPPGLYAGWLGKVWGYVKCWETIIPVARASNGEVFYRFVADKEGADGR